MRNAFLHVFFDCSLRAADGNVEAFFCYANLASYLKLLSKACMKGGER